MRGVAYTSGRGIPYVQSSAGRHVKNLLSGFAVWLLLQTAAWAQSNKYAVILSSLGVETSYNSLTQAFAAVKSGDTIRLYPGVHQVVPGYTEGAHGIGDAPLKLWEKTNVTVVGVGSDVVIRGDGPGDFLLVRSCKNIVLETLVFRGNKPEVSGSQLFAAVNFSGTNSNIRNSGCSFLDQGNHGVSHLWGDKTTRRVTISECRFVVGGDLNVGGDIDGAAISGIGSDWLVVNNRIESWARGVEIENSGTSVVENVSITGNILSDIRNIGVMVFATSHDASKFINILISGNQIRDTYSGTNTVNALPLQIGGGENITISRNLINGATSAGIYLMTTHSDIRNCIVAHNQVENCGWRGIQVYGADGYTCENVLIDGNYVAHCDHSGILARGRNLTIVNNILQNNSCAGGDVGAGIELNAGTEGAMVMGNRCWDNASAMQQDYGIWLHAGVSNAMLRDNWLLDNLVANLRDESTGSDSFGNRVSAVADTTYMEINTSGGGIALTWPRSSLSYKVQAASNVLPLAWIDAPCSVSVVNDKNFTIVPAVYTGVLYRLQGE